jgi:quercetin dioxygenase-like cupin family protein
MSPLFGRRTVGPEVRPVPRAEWSPLDAPGCRNVDAKVLVAETEVTVAMLRFAPDGTIEEHEADHETEVVCLEGNGHTSIDGQAAEMHTGE